MNEHYIVVQRFTRMAGRIVLPVFFRKHTIIYRYLTGYKRLSACLEIPDCYHKRIKVFKQMLSVLQVMSPTPQEKGFARIWSNTFL